MDHELRNDVWVAAQAGPLDSIEPFDKALDALIDAHVVEATMPLVEALEKIRNPPFHMNLYNRATAAKNIAKQALAKFRGEL